MRPSCGSRSIAGRYLARIRAARIETAWMSSASLRSRATAPPRHRIPSRPGRRRPSPRRRSPVRPARSAPAGRPGGSIARTCRAATFTNGSGASATSASRQSVANRMTVTPRIIARFDSVIGIITTNDWIWVRSLDDRLISWPVWRPVVVADVQRHDVVEEAFAQPGLGPAGLAERVEATHRGERADGDAGDRDQRHPEPQHLALLDAAVDAVAHEERHGDLAERPERARRRCRSAGCVVGP